jgi:hypothetical protein
LPQIRPTPAYGWADYYFPRKGITAMRKTLFNVAVVAIAGLTSLTSPAHATTYSSTSCSATTSTRLVDNSLLGSGQNRVWVEAPTLTRRIVCFDIPFGNTGGGAIVVDAAPGQVPGPILPGDTATSCPFYTIDSANPVVLRLGVNQSTSTVCLVVADKTLTLTFTGQTGGVPQNIQVWRDGKAATLDVAACPVSYTVLLVTGVNDGCISSNARII